MDKFTTTHKYKFYIDVGNSQVKIAIFNDQKNSFYPIHIISPSKPIRSVDDLCRYWSSQGWEKYSGSLFVISVVPEWKEVWNAFAHKLHYTIHFITNRTAIQKYFNPQGLSNARLSEIGEDLLVTSFYGAQHYNSCIIINCGTSTTFTVIKKQKILGYALMPGIELAGQAFISKASLLKPMTLTASDAMFSLVTKEAVSIGTVNVMWKGIKQHVQDILDQYFACSISPVIVFTGFNVNYFQHLMRNYQNNINYLFNLTALKFWWDKNSKFIIKVDN